jgi:hypothetical protein
VLLFFSRQLRFSSSQFLCLPLPRNNHIHSKSIPTPGNKKVLLTKSLTTSQTRQQQHFSTASFCLVQHSSFLYFYTIPGLFPSFSSTPFPLLLLLVLPENQNLDNYLPYLPKALQLKTPHLQNNHQMSKPLSSHPPTQFFHNHPTNREKKTKKKTSYLKTPRKCMNLLLQQQLQLLLSYYSYSFSFPNPLSCFSPSLPSPPPPPLPAAAAAATAATATPPPPVPAVVVTPDENDKPRHQPIPQNALYISLQQEVVVVVVVVVVGDVLVLLLSPSSHFLFEHDDHEQYSTLIPSLPHSLIMIMIINIIIIMVVS